MKTWLLLRSPVLIVAFVSATLLLIWLVVVSGRGAMIVPKPEVTAEQMMKALAAHRYQGALEALSSPLESATSAADLARLVKQAEQTHGKIEQAEGVLLDQQESSATASVQVQFNNGVQRKTNIPLVKESGIWKVAGLDGLNALSE